MSQDAYGNYIADVQSAGIVFAPDGTLLSGTGAPSDSLGDNGSIYVDLSTGDIYTKSNDVWTVFSGGGGGGGGEVGVVDPEGVVTASPGTIYTNTANRTIWVKESGTGNTGWFMYV